MRMPPKKKAAGLPPSTMSTARFEMGLEILSELDTQSILALLEDQALEGEGGENAAIVGLLGSALKSRLLRRLSAVALASEDELEEAEENPKAMDDLVKLRGRAPWMENFQAVKGFFTLLGISDLATLASFAGAKAMVREGQAEDPSLEPPPSDG